MHFSVIHFIIVRSRLGCKNMHGYEIEIIYNNVGDNKVIYAQLAEI